MASGSGQTVAAKKTLTTRRNRKEETQDAAKSSKIGTRKSSTMQQVKETSNKKKLPKSPAKESTIEGKKQSGKETKNITETETPIKAKRSTKNTDTKVVDNSEAGERKFECQYCQKGLKRKYDMEKHARKHSGDKPYKCGICGNQVKYFSLLDFTSILTENIYFSNSGKNSNICTHALSKLY